VCTDFGVSITIFLKCLFNNDKLPQISLHETINFHLNAKVRKISLIYPDMLVIFNKSAGESMAMLSKSVSLT